MPTLGEAQARKSSLYREFQASQRYIIRPCYNSNINNKTTVDMWMDEVKTEAMSETDPSSHLIGEEAVLCGGEMNFLFP